MAYRHIVTSDSEIGVSGEYSKHALEPYEIAKRGRNIKTKTICEINNRLLCSWIIAQAELADGISSNSGHIEKNETRTKENDRKYAKSAHNISQHHLPFESLRFYRR